jgi:hypothetical protein
MMFDQYLRSPSLSPVPSPHDTTSELSVATLVEAEHDQRVSSADLSTDTPRFEPLSPIPEPLPKKEQLEYLQDTGHRESGLRLRLLVSRPKITLRLKLPVTRQGGTKETEGKRKTAKQETRRGKVKKGDKRVGEKKGAKKGAKRGEAKKAKR